ncbi:hypothetical protein AVV36_gp083 [Pectobacterium bacteriophage PM2]|uniref:Uncharacterized protein n=1 Tax=Pectobacterium bacteriophage PM2 TaxID=1429794 RepID=A0A0A0Q2E3_9CAUD|nr:hypothetical protein AVV36_gp083 [Pectobacterium bacteriophage PM2]AHY25045.1 hypothetical protein PM2_083 [Pectobacterium bacteriophage PM2]
MTDFNLWSDPDFNDTVELCLNELDATASSFNEDILYYIPEWLVLMANDYGWNDSEVRDDLYLILMRSMNNER